MEEVGQKRGYAMIGESDVYVENKCAKKMDENNDYVSEMMLSFKAAVRNEQEHEAMMVLQNMSEYNGKQDLNMIKDVSPLII